jgi:Uma2 family endonuclease
MAAPALPALSTIDPSLRRVKWTVAFYCFLNWLYAFLPTERVRTEKSLRLLGDDAVYSEPQPDIVVTSLSPQLQAQRHPLPPEVELVIELADFTLALDTRIKSALYARSHLIEYWVYDINRNQLVVHRDPSATGYREVFTATEAAPLFAPERNFRVPSTNA